jgi:hypothetical protein
MKEGEKQALALAGGIFIGWLLFHKKSTAEASGDVNISFSPQSVQYSVTDSNGNATIPSTYEPKNVILPAGNYTVDMRAIGG